MISPPAWFAGAVVDTHGELQGRMRGGHLDIDDARPCVGVAAALAHAAEYSLDDIDVVFASIEVTHDHQNVHM